MKRILPSFILGLFLLTNLNIFGKNFNIKPSKTLIFTAQSNIGNIETIKLYNLGTVPLSLSWRLLSNTLPIGFDYSICDLGHCYPGLPTEVKLMNDCPVGDFAFFNLDVSPYDVAGRGMVKILVYETANPSSSDTVTFIVNSPIPDPGMESWTDSTTLNEWGTLNSWTSPDSIYTAMQTTGFDGNSGVQLINKSKSGFGVIPGLAATGSIDTANFSVSGGFICAKNYPKFYGNFKHFSTNPTDTAMVKVVLFKFNTGTSKRDTIGQGNLFITNNVAEYQRFEISINYSVTTNPDSAVIILTSGKNKALAKDGSYLIIDNLAFYDNSIGASVNDFKKVNAQFTLFPNPAKSFIQIQGNWKPGSFINIFSIGGKLLCTEPINGIDPEIDLSGYHPGTYLLSIREPSGIKTALFIKN